MRIDCKRSTKKKEIFFSYVSLRKIYRKISYNVFPSRFFPSSKMSEIFKVVKLKRDTVYLRLKYTLRTNN